MTLPMCQDTGTAIVMGKRGQQVATHTLPPRCPNFTASDWQRHCFICLHLPTSFESTNSSPGAVGFLFIDRARVAQVITTGDDEEMLSAGVYDTYTGTNLRYSQVAPLNMFDEANTKTNLPAQIDIYGTQGDEYNFLFIAKGGGSANKTFLYQQTKALLNPASLKTFLEEKIKSLGTAACPPYHLAVVVGGLSAEMTLKTVKLASVK